MTDDTPMLSTVLQNADALRPGDADEWALTIDGTVVELDTETLFSPAALKRAVGDAVDGEPVNDYPERDPDAHGVYELEDDIDALLARTGERGDE